MYIDNPSCLVNKSSLNTENACEETLANCYLCNFYRKPWSVYTHFNLLESFRDQNFAIICTQQMAYLKKCDPVVENAIPQEAIL